VSLIGGEPNRPNGLPEIPAAPQRALWHVSGSSQAPPSGSETPWQPRFSNDCRVRTPERRAAVTPGLSRFAHGTVPISAVESVVASKTSGCCEPLLHPLRSHSLCAIIPLFVWKLNKS
jgi:hypothetical protein